MKKLLSSLQAFCEVMTIDELCQQSTELHYKSVQIYPCQVIGVNSEFSYGNSLPNEFLEKVEKNYAIAFYCPSLKKAIVFPENSYMYQPLDDICFRDTDNKWYIQFSLMPRLYVLHIL